MTELMSVPRYAEMRGYNARIGKPKKAFGDRIVLRGVWGKIALGGLLGLLLEPLGGRKIARIGFRRAKAFAHQ